MAVCGQSQPDAALESIAEEVGQLLAEAGAILICGGLGGVMEAASRGASTAGGLVLSILPGDDRKAANPHGGVVLATGLGSLRDGLIVRGADVVIAIGGGWGTLSEIAQACRLGRPVIAIGSWELRSPNAAENGLVSLAPGARMAVAMALEAIADGS